MPNTRTSITPFLTVLRDAVSRLPDTIPNASVNDAIYKHFHNDNLPDGTAFQTFERAFQQCFEPSPKAPPRTNNILRGEHGMDLVVAYLEDFAKYPAMSSEELKLVPLKIQKLVDLVHERIKDAPKPTERTLAGRKSQRGRKKGISGTKRVIKNNVPESRHSDPYDADFTPEVGVESSGEELDVGAERESGILGFGKTRDPEEQVESLKQDTRLDSDDSVEVSDMAEISIRRAGPKPGRLADKGNWAMENFSKTPAAANRSKNEPIWVFRCIWCGASRSIARTPGCSNWDMELPEMKIFSRSNFISHVEKRCNKIPQDRKLFGASYPAASEEVRQAEGVVLSQQEFNSALVKAVVHDNYAMTFGEGNGMIQFFQLVLPNVRLPSHQTLQRHLYHLYDSLGDKIKDRLKSINRHAIATDAWSSKNSVYALAGVILFYIDTNWCLRELVIDVINLDAEHSGAHMGKLVYRSLKAKETAGRAIACVTDNASANAVMNATLAKRIQEREDTHVHGKGMSFTCVNHAFHLVCTDILSHLGIIEPGDHFSDVKGDESDLEGDSEGK